MKKGREISLVGCIVEGKTKMGGEEAEQLAAAEKGRNGGSRGRRKSRSHYFRRS
jgi:hypothetical protein